MKSVCCDTSFLVSLYVRDAHNAAANRCLAKLNSPLSVSPFNQFEFEQAIRFLVWRGMFTAQEAAQYQASFDIDCNQGQFVLARVNVTSILNEARRLSSRHTTSGGFRTLDIIQVAAAVHIGATEFLTFDANQRKLAHAEGLKVRP